MSTLKATTIGRAQPLKLDRNSTKNGAVTSRYMPLPAIEIAKKCSRRRPVLQFFDNRTIKDAIAHHFRTAAGTAWLHDKQPRQISFTSICQYLLASWVLTSCELMDKAKVESYNWKLLEQIAECEVANRPERLEPRAVKRRPKPYKLMQKPRNKLQRELRKRCT